MSRPPFLTALENAKELLEDLKSEGGECTTNKELLEILECNENGENDGEGEKASGPKKINDTMRRMLSLGNINPNIQDLTLLTKLDLFGAGLSSLPNDDDTMMATTLPNLEILFLMKNEFTQVPAVIGSCPKLNMVSFKSNRISSIHPDALQPQMRWLILTDNRLTEIPPAIGRCTNLRKLMLAGNLLTKLPNDIYRCQSLELVRLASNRLEEAPFPLLSLPNLAWVAFSDNPFLKGGGGGGGPATTDGNDHFQLPTLDVVNSDQDDENVVLGSGASGTTSKKQLNDGTWVAVKEYATAQITSDGNPSEERRVALVVASSSSSSSLHTACLVKVLGQTNHGSLVMELLEDYDALGRPPSTKSCTRDVYDDQQQQLNTKHALSMVSQLLDVLIQLHKIGINHGDFYAHNILVSNQDHSVVKLTDFGAAFFYEKDSDYGYLVQKTEMRAFGHFVQEISMLMQRSTTCDSSSKTRLSAVLQNVSDACLGTDPEMRSFTDVGALLRHRRGFFDELENK